VLPFSWVGKITVQIIGCILSVVILLWLLRLGDIESVAGSLHWATLPALVFTILLGYLAFPLRVEQWRLLLGMPQTATRWKTLRAICLGHVGNVLLPMRGGEAVRAVLLSRSCAIPLPRVFVSVGLNRVQDLPAILLIVAAVFVLNPLDPPSIESVTKVLGVSFAPTQADITSVMRALGVTIAAVGLCLAYFYWRPGLRLTTRLTANHNFPGSQRLIGILQNLGEGMEVIGHARYFWTAQGLSFVCWGIFLIAPIPLLMSFGLDFKHAALTAIVQTGLTTIAHMLPSAPGAIGTWHAFCLVAVLSVNPVIDPNTAIAYTFLAHLVSTVSPALPGLLFLPWAWKDLFHKPTATTTLDVSAQSDRQVT
jgi:hypothetical protein